MPKCTSVWDIITSFLGFPPGESQPKPDFTQEGPQIPIVSPPPEPVDPFALALDDPDVEDPDDPYNRDSDPFNKIAEADSLSQAESGLWEGGDNGGEDEGNCEHCDDENCDGCANNDDEGDDGSGLPDEESSTEGNNG